MEYPLAERELRRLAQRPMTFVTRAALALVACPILSFFLLADAASGGVAAQADEIASTLSAIGNFYLFAVSVLIPPFLTSGLIAAEKHERTLGTLLIADFSASDVILSKFVPTLLQLELLVLGSLPILAFATILGGITPGVLVISVLLFSITALMVSSIGLLASTVARQPGGALMGTVVVLAPLLAVDLWGSSIFGFGSAPVLMPALAAFWLDNLSGPDVWVPSVLIALVTSLVAVGLSILLLPRQVYAQKVRAPGRYRNLRRPINPFLRERGTSLIFSRAAGGLSGAVQSVLLRIVFGVALALIALIPCLGILFVAGIVMFDVVSTMDNAKRSGVLDDIRLSAPDPKTFLWDVYYALWMRGWFYLPGVIIGGTMAFGGWIADAVISGGANADWYTSAGFILLVVVAVVVAGVAQLGLMTAIGCYQSGYGRNIRAQTFTCVLLYVVVCMVSYLIVMISAGITSSIIAIMPGDLFGPAIVTTVGAVLATVVMGLWTLGFYSSYKTRHLPYV